MIGAIIGLLVLLVVLGAVLPVLGAVAIAVIGVLAAVFAIGLVARLLGSAVSFGFGVSQMTLGLLLSVLGLLLLLGTFGAIGVLLVKLWPLLLIGFGVWWLLRPSRY